MELQQPSSVCNLSEAGYQHQQEQQQEQAPKQDMPASRFQWAKVHISLVLAQALFAGFEVLSRVALDGGVGLTSFTFYRNCLATLLLGSYGIAIERRSWSKLSLRNIAYIFYLGFLGVTMNQLCYLVGLSLTSVMFASAIRNTIPIMTFILAYLFKLETVNLRKKHGRAKLAGAIIGLMGSLVLSLFKGPVIVPSHFTVFHTPPTKLAPTPSSSPSILHSTVETHTLHFFTTQVHFRMVSWHLGAIFLILSGGSFATFLILQVPVLKTYKAPVSFASLCCLSSTIQVPLVGAAFEPRWSAWRNINLGQALSIVYAGAIGSGIVSGVQSWAVQHGGPVIVAAYQPLETLITASLSFFFLDESLHLGTLVGGLTIVLGLYILVWGQKIELKEQQQGELTTVKTRSIMLGCFSCIRHETEHKSTRVMDESIV